MKKHHLIFACILTTVLLLSTLSGATTSTTKPKMEQVKESWNSVLCTILKVVEYAAVGLATLMIMLAGLKYMTSEDAAARQGAKQMIIRVLIGLTFIFSAVHVVNYLTTGTRIERFDIGACNATLTGQTGSSITTTRAEGPTSSTVTSSRQTTTSTSSATPTTSCLSSDTDKALHQIRACEMAHEFRHLEPGEDLCKVITVVPADCCCSQLGKCCPE